MILQTNEPACRAVPEWTARLFRLYLKCVQPDANVRGNRSHRHPQFP